MCIVRAAVRIVSVEYYSAEEAPFPVEKTKHMIRKYEKIKNPMWRYCLVRIIIISTFQSGTMSALYYL